MRVLPHIKQTPAGWFQQRLAFVFTVQRAGWCGCQRGDSHELLPLENHSPISAMYYHTGVMGGNGIKEQYIASCIYKIYFLDSSLTTFVPGYLLDSKFRFMPDCIYIA